MSADTPSDAADASPMAGLMQAVMSELASVKAGLSMADERRAAFERQTLARLEEMQAALNLLKPPAPTVEVPDEDIVDIAEFAAEHDAEIARQAADADEA